MTKNTAVSGARCDSCGSAATTTYDANGNVTSRKDFNGNLTCYTNDLARNLETKRVEGLSGASCPGTSGSATRTISTQWHATFRLPSAIAEPKRITSFSYDTKGNLTAKTIQATTDASGAAGFSATPTGTARSWTYTHTYHPSIAGFITQTTVDGPRTDVADVTTYSYDSTSGALASITNALGHVSTFGNFDPHGRARRITDANGLITDLTYDVRGRLTLRSVGGELTTYDYDGVGQLTKVTLPDGSSLAYSYDGAHRLTQIQDNLGNKIAYTLDAMGNRVSEAVSDPAGSLARKRQREYSSQNRLSKDIGGASPTTEITQYGYDTQGNLTSLTDALGKITTQQYDALNRLIKTIEPAASGAGAGGNTQYAYDGLDQLTQVTDPRNLATTYTLDGLARLTTQVSPDTGTTTKTFDAAGNVLTQTDARNVVASFTYDALNRLTQATYTPPGGSGIAAVTLTYSYDAGTYGKGKLTGFTDPSGSTSYVYDQKGRLTSETRTIAGVTSATQYSYDSAGRLSRLTYPSGRMLDYSYDAAGRVVALDTTAGGVTQSVASSVTYHPFGTVKSLLFGNATPYSRSFDLGGRISGYTLANLSRARSVSMPPRASAASRTTTRPSTRASPNNLSRITSWSGLSTSQSFAYDLTGNRTSLSIGASSYPYTVQATSNRVTQTAGPGGVKSFGFDAAGNTTSAGALTFGYDARGRMVSASTALGPVTYQVNALGQRVAKTVGGVTTRYHFDANGNLIGESGTTSRDYAWLGSLPMAILEGSSAYFVHADHLDTPRVVTNAANTIIWRWDSDPFGFFAASEDPDGNAQSFTMNLRFPGQYFDKETNLHYNTFRDYDPQIGRYVQSDLIGLQGGANTYGYVGQNPARNADRLGLSPLQDGAATSGTAYVPGLFDVFVPGTPANKAFGRSIAQIGKAIRERCSPGDDAERCKDVLTNCRKICLDQYTRDPNGLPGTGSDYAGRQRRCIRECMETNGCYDF
ncbi:MAG TPA: RHS repeat-associated core domain-containing protein [Burkholderiales bacterium]|nr:RHS repeat-associated core domain-containing protein [Burkholderiales bacterium]